MKKKESTQKKKTKLRNQADRLYQEIGTLLYKKCLICGGKLSCLHHYFPKSTSAGLRYDKDNLIPICQGCHFRHHNGDPRIQNAINEIKGKEWLTRLAKKKYEDYPKQNKQYYELIIKQYGEIN